MPICDFGAANTAHQFRRLATKHWPETYWQQLITQAVEEGHHLYLPWGNSIEKSRAERLASLSDKVEVLPPMNLNEVAKVIANAKAIVALDTGLAHMAAAFAIPTITLYGPTNPNLTGTVGSNQTHLAANFSCAPCLQRHCHYSGEKRVDPPCYSTVSPERVWNELTHLL